MKRDIAKHYGDTLTAQSGRTAEEILRLEMRLVDHERDTRLALGYLEDFARLEEVLAALGSGAERDEVHALKRTVASIAFLDHGATG